MERANWHTFQVLTKRSSLMRDFLRRRYGEERGPRHIWLGVSVEDGSKKVRIRHLQESPAGARFLWIEPLIGPMGELHLTGIDWVIVGGESGPGARPMIRIGCAKFAINVLGQGWRFSLQAMGRLAAQIRGPQLDRREWNEFPKVKSSLIPWLGNDMVSLSDYTGREQSYVKHVFLERYLERLVHKTASSISAYRLRRWLRWPLAERK